MHEAEQQSACLMCNQHIVSALNAVDRFLMETGETGPGHPRKKKNQQQSSLSSYSMIVLHSSVIVSPFFFYFTFFSHFYVIICMSRFIDV